MPDETVYITDVERDILQVFIKNKTFDDATILAALRQLIDKLEK